MFVNPFLDGAAFETKKARRAPNLSCWYPLTMIPPQNLAKKIVLSQILMTHSQWKYSGSYFNATIDSTCVFESELTTTPEASNTVTPP